MSDPNAIDGVQAYPKTPTNETEALQTLADFARTAPGALPERVTKALDIAGRVFECVGAFGVDKDTPVTPASGLGVTEPTIEQARDTITRHLAKNYPAAELKGDPGQDPSGEWLALVSLAPSGPLVRMGFRMSPGMHETEPAWDMSVSVPDQHPHIDSMQSLAGIFSLKLEWTTDSDGKFVRARLHLGSVKKEIVGPWMRSEKAAIVAIAQEMALAMSEIAT